MGSFWKIHEVNFPLTTKQIFHPPGPDRVSRFDFSKKTVGECFQVPTPQFTIKRCNYRCRWTLVCFCFTDCPVKNKNNGFVVVIPSCRKLEFLNVQSQSLVDKHDVLKTQHPPQKISFHIHDKRYETWSQCWKNPTKHLLIKPTCSSIRTYIQYIKSGPFTFGTNTSNRLGPLTIRKNTSNY